MNALHALLLGAIQGLTEFLPISSSGHLILVPWLLGWSPSGLAFDVALHLGTAAAVLLYFGREWIALARGVLRGLALPAERHTPQWRLAWMIVLGSIPAGLAGVALGSTVEEHIRQPWLVAGLLVLFGVLLGVADRASSRSRDLSKLTLREAVLIGLAQALALLPGTSRSGVTLTAALALGFTREAAARFSFLLSMPVVLGAVLFEFAKLLRGGGLQGAEQVFAIGIASSALVGIAAIRFLLGYLQRHSVGVFVAERIIAGLLVLVVSL